jgi:osmotically-inducible protein OsmY
MRTDTELQHAVMEELTWEPSVDAAEIGVSAESGIVTLRGMVKSLPQKWAAEKAAQRVSGVKAVTDEIVVKLPGDGELSDTEIARAVVNALDWNASVPRGRVKVVVAHGWVTLEGTVQFHYERVAAEYAVRGLIGVKGVTDLISVKPPQTSPKDIKQRIEQAFERAADLDAEMISVEAKDGKVTLRGTVDSWAEREQAELAAWAAPGVSHVKNEILIASGQEIVVSL